MRSSLEHEIREQLLAYLNGAITLDEFKDWLISETWDAPMSADRGAVALSYEALLALADQSSGLTTEREMQGALADLVSTAQSRT